MRRHIPVRVARVFYRWHPQEPCLVIQFAVLEPKTLESRAFSGRLYCTQKALWKSSWFLRDFGYDQGLLLQDSIDEKALVNLRGTVSTSCIRVNGHSYQNLEAF